MICRGNSNSKLFVRVMVLLAICNWPIGLHSAESTPISVTVVKPEKREVSRWIHLPGTAEADAEVILYAKVSGYLKGFKADIGDVVTPGVNLGYLDAPELEQDVKIAQTQLAAVQTELEAAATQAERTRLRKDDIDAKQAVLRAELEKAQAEATRSNIEYDRVKKLFATNAATEQERDNFEYAWKTQAAAAKAAQNRFDALKPERAIWQKDFELSQVAIEMAKQKIQSAQAALKRAEIWFAYSQLVVPQMGVHPGAPAMITKRFVSDGDLVSGGSGPRTGIQPIVTLQVIDPVRITIDVPETDAVTVKPGTQARITFHALPNDKPVVAQVSRSSSALWSTTRTMRVEIDIPNRDGRIKPGMMANVEIALESHKEVWTVPASAVASERQGMAVFIYASGLARKIPVRTGFEDHGWVEVLNLDAPEATEVIKEVRNLVDGAAIQKKDR